MKDGLDNMAVQRMARLEVIEGEIKEDIEAVARVAERFREIREDKLWSCRSASWKDYIAEQWGDRFNTRRADRLIESCVVRMDIESEGGTVQAMPVKSAQSLRRLTNRGKLAAWDAAKEKAGSDNPNSEQVEEAVKEVEAIGAEPMVVILAGERDFKTLVAEAKKLGDRIQELSKGRWGAELRSQMQQIDAGLHQVTEGLRQASPYCECPCRDGCRMCEAREPRWLSKAMFRSMPVALQRRVTDHT